jgi:hypothetical protein
LVRIEIAQRQRRPDVIVATVNGRQIIATRERVRTTSDELSRPGTFYRVITIDGTRYVGWLAEPDETEASVTASLERWIDKHPLSVSRRAGTDR